jgi:hypothetical protein
VSVKSWARGYLVATLPQPVSLRASAGLAVRAMPLKARMLVTRAIDARRAKFIAGDPSTIHVSRRPLLVSLPERATLAGEPLAITSLGPGRPHLLQNVSSETCIAFSCNFGAPTCLAWGGPVEARSTPTTKCPGQRTCRSRGRVKRFRLPRPRTGARIVSPSVAGGASGSCATRWSRAAPKRDSAGACGPRHRR